MRAAADDVAGVNGDSPGLRYGAYDTQAIRPPGAATRSTGTPRRTQYAARGERGDGEKDRMAARAEAKDIGEGRRRLPRRR